MPRVAAETFVPVDPDLAFAVSQTTGELRRRWDPFIRRQELLDAATAPAKGVRTRTWARLGPRMDSEYVSYRPPTSVGMTMVRGPWFFASFGGGWRFEAVEGGTRARWKYTFTTRPAWLSPVADRIGTWLLGREIEARIRAFARACEDPEVLAAVR
ncbi:SRPBCC family protein [Nocardioides sp. zg-536]|uniref:SRPBCC family protein n=1 Tax=Nocardioides faecalis TaxID=2803858 RepID=A0A938Y704_9ACTN|nr:SRPBCC family protein [Nocardioides faecalis]MBM9460430.1 SRPBCC family protein [Nocardioides faecalis]MBS4751355.1 SRPBCC family protein [Nocardioides faecalis]QVI59748.1 SRPBCC family protein [Nocardioides faecalis]